MPRKPVVKIPCAVCKREIDPRGFKTHMRSKHPQWDGKKGPIALTAVEVNGRPDEARVRLDMELASFLKMFTIKAA